MPDPNHARARAIHQLRSANAIAKDFAYDACRERHARLTVAALHGLWFVEALKDAGLPEHCKLSNDLATAVAGVIDMLRDTHGGIINAADGEGIAPECFPLDITELEAMHRATGGR